MWLVYNVLEYAYMCFRRETGWSLNRFIILYCQKSKVLAIFRADAHPNAFEGKSVGQSSKKKTGFH